MRAVVPLLLLLLLAAVAVAAGAPLVFMVGPPQLVAQPTRIAAAYLATVPRVGRPGALDVRFAITTALNGSTMASDWFTFSQTYNTSDASDWFYGMYGRVQVAGLQTGAGANALGFGPLSDWWRACPWIGFKLSMAGIGRLELCEPHSLALEMEWAPARATVALAGFGSSGGALVATTVHGVPTLAELLPGAVNVALPAALYDQWSLGTDLHVRVGALETVLGAADQLNALPNGVWRPAVQRCVDCPLPVLGAARLAWTLAVNRTAGTVTVAPQFDMAQRTVFNTGVAFYLLSVFVLLWFSDNDRHIEPGTPVAQLGWRMLTVSLELAGSSFAVVVVVVNMAVLQLPARATLYALFPVSVTMPMSWAVAAVACACALVHWSTLAGVLGGYWIHGDRCMLVRRFCYQMTLFLAQWSAMLEGEPDSLQYVMLAATAMMAVMLCTHDVVVAFFESHADTRMRTLWVVLRAALFFLYLALLAFVALFMLMPAARTYLGVLGDSVVYAATLSALLLLVASSVYVGVNVWKVQQRRSARAKTN